MKKISIVVAIMLCCGYTTMAYWPVNCRSSHADKDFTESEAIVIGRVVKMERVNKEIKIADRTILESTYFASVKIGKVIKGELKIGDTIRLFEGEYRRPKEDNADPTHLNQCNTHAQAGFQIDGIYLLFVKKSKEGDADLWAPRSCHCSIHKIKKLVNDDTDAERLMVSEGFFDKAGRDMELQEFLEMKKVQAERASKEDNHRSVD
jgi:hypothetical protein